MLQRNSLASLLGAILIGTGALALTPPAHAGKGDHDRQQVWRHSQDSHRHSHWHGHKTRHGQHQYCRHGGHRHYPDYGRYRSSHYHPQYGYGPEHIRYPHRGYGDARDAWDVVIRYSFDD